MQSHFKLDPPSQSRLPKYTARSCGLLLASGDDLAEVALRGCRLAYPSAHVTLHAGLRVVAVICPVGEEPFAASPQELHDLERLAAEHSCTVVATQEAS